MVRVFTTEKFRGKAVWREGRSWHDTATSEGSQELGQIGGSCLSHQRAPWFMTEALVASGSPVLVLAML